MSLEGNFVPTQFEPITIKNDAVVFAPLRKRFQVVVVVFTIFPMDDHIVYNADNAECLYDLLLKDI